MSVAPGQRCYACFGLEALLAAALTHKALPNRQEECKGSRNRLSYNDFQLSALRYHWLLMQEPDWAARSLGLQPAAVVSSSPV